MYSTTVVSLRASSDTAAEILDLRDHIFPQLVAKVALPNHEDDLRTEASFYEEMESLQGSAVARYYGMFEPAPGGGYSKLDLVHEVPPSYKGGSFRHPTTFILLERLGGRIPIQALTKSEE